MSVKMILVGINCRLKIKVTRTKAVTKKVTKENIEAAQVKYLQYIFLELASAND